DSRQQLVAFDRDLNIASDIDFETLLLTISSLCPTDAFASFASCDDLAFSNLLPTGGRLSRGFVGSLSERALPALLSTLRC
ncbi:MAG: hypothetical protein KDB23_13675, partial [Planctomycetales bacterium]|nr:hypothetical protein [Planctomycetales bacterium]